MTHIKLSLSILMAASSCSVAPTKTTAPVNPPAQVQQEAAPVAAVKSVQKAAVIAQPKGDWIDWPITNGNWMYRQDARGSIALFGVAGKDALVTVRCMAKERQIFFSRAGSPQNGAQMTIRTSHSLKTLAAAPTGGTPSYAAVAINPNDEILDALAYTRGRFAIEVTAMQSIAIPSWSEIVRVVEDCR